MSEWRILRNGKRWYGRIDTKELTVEQMNEHIDKDIANYEIMQMTDKEIEVYK